MLSPSSSSAANFQQLPERKNTNQPECLPNRSKYPNRASDFMRAYKCHDLKVIAYIQWN